MRTFKKVAAVLALSLGVTGLAACSGSGSKTELNLMVASYSDATKGLWEKYITEFNKANPDVKVNLDVQSWESINDTIRTKIQNNQAPDILNIDSFTSFANDGLLYEAKDIASEATLNNFPDNFRANASTGGKQYGLPLIASARALFYNKDLFAKAGVAAPPKTWAELRGRSEENPRPGWGYFRLRDASG